MKPMSFGAPWWPDDLGQPSSSGAQNEMRYAFFPEKRRLLIESHGKLTTYDSGDHRISGVSQQGSVDRSLAFTSQHGPVRLDELKVMGDTASPRPREGRPREGSDRPDGGAARSRDDDGDPEPGTSRRDSRTQGSMPPGSTSGGERVVFTEEAGGGRTLKLIASGEIDADMLEALEDFIKRQKRRLAGRAS